MDVRKFEIGTMNNSQFHELFGSQWPPDQHGGHSSASTMLHQTPGMPQGMQLKREPHTEVQGVMQGVMGMDITSGTVADSTSPPPGSSDGMFGSSISGMFMDKKAANSIRGIFNFLNVICFPFQPWVKTFWLRLTSTGWKQVFYLCKNKVFRNKNKLWRHWKSTFHSFEKVCNFAF